MFRIARGELTLFYGKRKNSQESLTDFRFLAQILIGGFNVPPDDDELNRTPQTIQSRGMSTIPDGAEGTRAPERSL